jgi:hypothetical protein
MSISASWARARRPRVLIFTVATILVTWLFKADVEAQGGAYATGVLALRGSAAFAVALRAVRMRSSQYVYVGIALVFVYTTVTNVIERPEGLKIAGWFIMSIVITSLISRVARSTELRIQGVVPDGAAQRLIDDVAHRGQIRIIANRPDAGDVAEYEHKLREARGAHHLPTDIPVLFLEIRPGDASEFSNTLAVEGHEVHGYGVLIAALLLYIRETTALIPHVYFGWTEGNPIAYLLKFLAFGEGDTAPVAREVLRQNEPDPERRPRIHVG